MELEEAIKICEDFIDENKERKIILHTAIQTIIEELEIYKKKYELAIETVLKELDLKKYEKTLKEKELNYTIGFYEGKNFYKKKIEEKITHYNKRLEEDEILDWIVKDKIIINVLQELLKEEN